MSFDIAATFDRPVNAYRYLSECLLELELQILELNHNKHMRELSVQKANTDTLSTNKITSMRAMHTIEFARKTIDVYNKQLANLQSMKHIVEHRLSRLREHGITDETLHAHLLEYVDENDSRLLGPPADSEISLHGC